MCWYLLTTCSVFRVTGICTPSVKNSTHAPAITSYSGLSVCNSLSVSPSLTLLDIRPIFKNWYAVYRTPMWANLTYGYCPIQLCKWPRIILRPIFNSFNSLIISKKKPQKCYDEKDKNAFTLDDNGIVKHKAINVTVNTSTRDTDDELSDDANGGYRELDKEQVEISNIHKEVFDIHEENAAIYNNSRELQNSVNDNIECDPSSKDTYTGCVLKPEPGVSCQLDRFLTDFHDAALISTHDSEIEDMTALVRDMVRFLLNIVSNIDSRFRCIELVPTGSVHDGTKILKPDEFDFLAVIGQDCDGQDADRQFNVARKCSEHAGFAHVVLSSEEASRKWLSISRENSIVSVDKGYGMRSFRELFRLHFHTVISHYIGHRLESPSGSLELSGFSVSINGPECTIDAQWKTKIKGSSDVDISVDVCPAFKSGQVDIIKRRDVPSIKTWNLLRDMKTFYLIPKPVESCSYCFKLVFASQDLDLVRSLSYTHKQCIIVLKHIAKLIISKHFCTKVAMNSFVMKTALIHHSHRCTNKQSLERCIMRVLKKIRESLAFSPPIMPSMFILDRNILKTVSRVDENVARITLACIDAVLEVFREMQDTHTEKEYKYHIWFRRLQDRLSDIDRSTNTSSYVDKKCFSENLSDVQTPKSTRTSHDVEGQTRSPVRTTGRSKSFDVDRPRSILFDVDRPRSISLCEQQKGKQCDMCACSSKKNETQL